MVGAHEHDFLDRFHIHSIFQTLTALEAWGVDLFFVISGFVMISVHYNDFGTPYAPARFFIRRAVRIFPMYWLLTLFLFALFTLMPSLLHNWMGGHSNLVLSLLLLMPKGTNPLLWVGWTLVFEMYFYYVFTASLRFSRRRATILACWAAVLLVLQFVPISTNRWYQTLTDGLVLEFTMGVLVGVLIAKRIVLPSIMSAGIVLAGALSLVLYFLAVHDPTHELNVDFPFRFFFVGVPMALIVYGAVGLELARRLVLPQPFLFLGDASYSIYLSHAIVYVALARIVSTVAAHRHLPALFSIVVIPIIVVLLGCAVYYWLERPLLEVSRARAEKWFPKGHGAPLRSAAYARASTSHSSHVEQRRPRRPIATRIVAPSARERARRRHPAAQGGRQ